MIAPTDTIGDDVKLYCGDALTVLPTLATVDAVVTDPPYGINAARDRNSQQWGWKDYPSGGWDKERPSREAFAAVLAASSRQIIWGGNYFADMLPLSPLNRWLIWDKGQTGFSLADAELAWCSFDGAIRRLTYHRARALVDGKEHATQKPIAVMKWCIDRLKLQPGATILDPYMGSGTTGVAAMGLGFKFIGIELDPTHYATALSRLTHATGAGPGQLFGAFS